MKRITISLIFIFLMSQCKTSRTTVSAYYNFEPQYVNSPSHGSDCIRIFATGSTREECQSKAKLLAMKQILFKGVKGAPDERPLVLEINAESKYKDYFNDFLSPRGNYLYFIKISRAWTVYRKDVMKTKSRENGGEFNIGVEVVIDKTSLRNELVSSKIITQ